MQKRFNFLILLFFETFICLSGRADEFIFEAKETTHRSSMILSVNLVQLQTPDIALSGFGGMIAYRYALNSKCALRPQLGQAFGTTGGGKSLFTSLGGMAEYAVTGSYLWGEVQYETKATPVAKFIQSRGPMWSAGMGFEQLFLSGSDAVYAAPGFTGLVAYNFFYSERPYGIELKFGRYSSNEKPFTGITLNVLSEFDL